MDAVILSISILISKRPDTVTKCLESVKPLLESVPSELILVDTGCGRDVREVIEKYTDHIIPFTWCRDFSKARNAGLKEAKGKWFLYLDDDEWFEDTSEISDFFLSGDYKNYGYGMYVQRNYTNFEGTLYNDALVGRMIRLDRDTHFIYSIHERFHEVSGKTKRFSSYVHHFGYVYKNEMEIYLHAERNIALLLKEHRQERGNLKHILQLAQEYVVIGEFLSSLHISEEGIASADQGMATELFCLNSLLANVLECHQKLFQYHEMIEKGNVYLGRPDLDELAAAIIYGKLAMAYFEAGRYGDAIKAAEEYMTRYRWQCEDKDIFLPYFTSITENAFSDQNRSLILSCGIRAAIKLERMNLAWKWFTHFDWAGHVLYASNEMIEEIVKEYVDSKGHNKIAEDMCNTILKRKQLETFLITTIDDILDSYRAEEAAGTDKTRLDSALPLECLARLESSHWYFALLRLRALKMKGAVSEDYTVLYRSLWAEVREVLPVSVKYGMWKMSGQESAAVKEVLEEVPFWRWEAAVRNCMERMKHQERLKCREALAGLFSGTDERMQIWDIYEMPYLIRDGLEASEDMEGIMALFGNYAQTAVDYYKKLYREDVFQAHADMLPVECQSALIIERLDSCIEAGGYREAADCLKELAGLMPCLAEAVKLYSVWLNQRMEDQAAVSLAEQREFLDLSRAVKGKVREMLDQGDQEGARAVLKQLEAMMGEDEDIRQLKRLAGA